MKTNMWVIIEPMK